MPSLLKSVGASMLPDCLFLCASDDLCSSSGCESGAYKIAYKMAGKNSRVIVKIREMILQG